MASGRSLEARTRCRPPSGTSSASCAHAARPYWFLGLLLLRELREGRFGDRSGDRGEQSFLRCRCEPARVFSVEIYVSYFRSLHEQLAKATLTSNAKDEQLVRPRGRLVCLLGFGSNAKDHFVAGSG